MALSSIGAISKMSAQLKAFFQALRSLLEKSKKINNAFKLKFKYIIN